MTDWKHDGVRVIPAKSLDPTTAQTPGMNRAAAINFARVGAQKIWAGTVTIHAHAKTGGNVVAVMEVPREQTKSYGIVALKGGAGNGLAEMTGIVEKPAPEKAPSTLAWIGRSVVLPEVFDHLDKHETGAGGEIQLTDAMAKMIGHHPFHALTYTGQRYDCGSRIGFLEANVGVSLSRDETAGETRALLQRLLKG